MRRQRVQAPCSLDDLLHTICAISPDRKKRPPSAARPTVSGKLSIAPIDKMCRLAGKDEQFAPYWAELHGDVLTCIPSVGESAPLGPIHVAFCTKVDPPAAELCSSLELRAAAEKILATEYLAMYTADRSCFWIKCDLGECA